jgi:hypothetical protein
MSTAIAQSGLPFLENLSWGTHFCQFCEQPGDLLEVLVSYFKAGARAR